MNGKHPIDEHFARTLRDAEAMPPAAVWEGIAHDRERKRAAVAQRRRLHLGMLTLLLLLLGLGGYFMTSNERREPLTNAHTRLPEEAGATTDARSEEAPRPPGPTAAERNDPEPRSTLTQGRSATGPATGRSDSASPVGAPSVMSTSTPPSAHGSGRILGGADMTEKNMDPGVPTISATTHSNTGDAVSHGADPGDTFTPWTSVKQPKRGAEDRTGQATNREASLLVSLANIRTRPVSLPTPASIIQPIANTRSDSTAPYVIATRNVWLAIQGTHAWSNGQWMGGSPEIPALNAGETWLDRSGLGLAAGIQWLNGWSVGMGVGISRQRSRFLHHQQEAGYSEMVVDTTWIATPMGPVTNYTWDIVESMVTEPGVEHDYRATNSYTHVWLSPEVSYRLVDRGRFTLHARLDPAIAFNIDRSGNTLRKDGDGPVVVTPLEDPRMDDRFRPSFSFGCGMEFRYRFSERFSVCAIPAYRRSLSPTGTDTPSLSIGEVSGTVRLRYDLPHRERRSKGSMR